MIIDKFGSVDYSVKGFITTKDKIILGDNQFIQWTPTGKRLELWEGKKEYLEDDDTDFNIYRIKYWNQNSILAII